MAQVTVNGQSYAVPDDMPPEAAMKMIMQAHGTTAGNPEQQEGATAPSAPAKLPADHGTINPDDLQFNKDWVGSAKRMYKSSYGSEFSGTDKEAADYGLDKMGWFNYNLPNMAVNAARLKSMPEEDKKAFLNLMDTYDHLGYSWGGAWRFIKGAAVDPTTYLGLTTLGFSAAGSQVAKAATKTGIKAMLQTGVNMAIDGAAISAAQDYTTQTARVNAGGQDEVHGGQVALSAGVGAVAGAALGAGAEAVKGILPKGVQKALGKKDAAPWEGVERDIADGKIKVATVTPDPSAPAIGEGKPIGEITAPKELPKATITDAPEIPAGTVTNPADRLIGIIREAAKGFNIEAMPKDLTKDAGSATEYLAKSSVEDLTKVWEGLKTATVNTPENSLLKASFKDSWEQLQAHSELLWAEYDANPSPDKFLAHEQVKNIRDKIKIGDELFSSVSGSDLASRVGGMNVEGKLRGITPETFLVKEGVDVTKATDAQKIWANQEYYKLANEYREGVKKSNDVLALTEKHEQLLAQGDVGGAIQVSVERRKLMDELAAKKGESLGFGRKVLNDVNTYIISTVFSTSTLVINTVPSLAKTIYRPMLDFLTTGVGDKAAAKQMITQYHTMASSMDTAFRAAKAAFEYEHGLYNATKFGSKFDEMSVGTGAFDNQFGRALRIFPRLLGATDEFFGQLHYRSFYMGQEAAKAVESAHTQGLVGAEFDRFLSEHLTKQQEKMFTKDTVHSADVMDFLRDAAANKGLKNEKAQEWIKIQLEKNDDLLRIASSSAGVDYADDILFKRKFSGDNAASRMAKDYEEFVQKNPWMRPMGQLFFRTPVRVFEEGFRVTPGLNLITPQFIADLRGANGQARYARAMGEAMVGYGIGMYIMTQYAAGNITGGGPEDYKQRRLRESAGDWKPYTMKVGEHTIDFRNIDPFSTPMKIMVNALERYNHLLMRQSQGEFVHDTEVQKALSFLQVGVGSIAQAVKDANLTDGMEQLSKLQENLMDPEDKDKAFARFFGQKSTLIIPNMLKKGIQQRDTAMPDPVAVDQFIRASVNPSSEKVSHQHDVLGNLRHYTDVVGGLTGLKIGDPKARMAGMAPEQQYVLKTLSDLSIATGKTFAMPVKNDKLFPRQDDLRTEMSSDGTSTLYDKVNTKLRETPLAMTLYYNLKGTEKLPAVKRAEAADKVLKQFRDMAMTRVWQEEAGIQGDMVEAKKEKIDLLTGKRDATSLPYRSGF